MMRNSFKKAEILMGLCLCTLTTSGCIAKERTVTNQHADSFIKTQSNVKSASTHQSSSDDIDKENTSHHQQDTGNNIRPLAHYYKIEDYIGVTTKEDIYKAFGKENTQEGQTSFAEGEFVQTHIIVTNLANSHQVKYLLKDNNKTVDAVQFFYQLYDQEGNLFNKQMIHSNLGIHTGMSLAQLLQWNDNEMIYFSGFGWDFGGGVMVSEGYLNPNSKLAKSGYGIRLDYDGTGDNFDVPIDYIGDVELSTKDKQVLNAPIVVDVITIQID